MAILYIILLATALYLSNHIYKIYRNYIAAKKTGLRVIVAPVDVYGLPWQLLLAFFGPALKRFTWARIYEPTFSWPDDDKYHKEFGLSFIISNAARNVLYTSDPQAIEHVLQKRKEFPKPGVYENLDMFGRNVDTVNGEDWARHRKLTAPCFNERVSSFVWSESLKQAQSMLSHWISQPNGKTSNMVEDTRVVALHVLSAAGFGVSHDFLGGARNPAPGHQLSHRDALMTILDNMITSIVASKMAWLDSGLVKVLLPERWVRVRLALKEFRLYMDEMIASERKLLSQKPGTSKPNLISTLIRTSDEAMAEGVQSAVRLTDDEIKGNIFIFNLAGHDTTANTLAYAFALLATYPEIQDWVVEEVDEVLNGEEGEVVYEKVFPRLKRVMAVMYETLRLYGPVPSQPRTAVPNTHLLITDPSNPSATTSLLIPPRTDVSLSIHACHTSSTNFPLPNVWNPKRWIQPGSSLPDEKFLHPTVAFAPWSLGPRICPGMKFAQVEFIGVLATILRNARVHAAVQGDENVGEEAARKEVMALLRDSALLGPTLSMKRPEEVWIRVVKR